MRRFCTLLLLILFSKGLLAQPEQIRESYRIMFYNVENYFDTEDDYETDDDDFLPVGFYRWTQAKFEKKRDDIAKVIEAIGNGTAPALVGLCEVENRYVLEQLVRYTSLNKYGYSILHQDSPDPRGIDVALLYLPQYFRLLDSAFFSIDIEKMTREILYAKGLLNNIDTLHIFVNHWSSKTGGEKVTEPYRMKAAQVLRCKTDSILRNNQEANIFVMGDFNDFYNSKPVQEELKTAGNIDSLKENDLYNLSTWLAEQGEGTSKYRGKWQLVDMMLCSPNMVRSNSKLYCNPFGFNIFKADFLLEEDKTYSGLKPKRTLIGPRYNGGTSDHLPVFIDTRATK